MNRKPKIVTIMIVLSFVCTIGYTQQTGTVTFTYDLDGNRISQTFSRDRGNENKGLAEDKATITSPTSPALDFFNEMQVELYPNPIHDELTLSIQDKPEDISILIRITAITGAIIQEKEVSGDRETFDMSKLPSGIYLLQLIDGDRIKTWKVMKN